MIQIFSYSNTFNRPPFLLEQFRGTDVERLLALGDSQLDEMETVLVSILSEIWIDDGIGNQLDILGRHLGLLRGGNTDENYRALLKLKAKINTSAATAETIIEAVKFLFRATTIFYYPAFPAGVTLVHDGLSGLFLYSDYVDDTADPIVDETGDQLIFGEPDLTSVEILESLAPSGVSLNVGNFFGIVFDTGELMVDNYSNQIQAVVLI